MKETAGMDLIELFRAYLSHYPSMRFGQAICAVAGWENHDDPTTASDEVLIAAIKEHLENRFEESAYDTAGSSMSDQLAAALREARRSSPNVALGKLLAPMVQKNNWNLYDMENEDLIVALKTEVAAFPKASAHEQPIPA